MVDDVMLKDAEIRHAMIAYLNAQNAGSDYRLLSEFAICDGLSRADIAVANQYLCGYEIKSDADTLVRLSSQVDFYNKTFDKAAIVVGEKYVDAIVKHIPVWWGIYYVADVNGAIAVTEQRPCQLNQNVDGMSLLELLWRDELYALLKLHGVRGIAGKNRRILRSISAVNIPFDDIKAYVLDVIKHRQNWRDG